MERGLKKFDSLNYIHPSPRLCTLPPVPSPFIKAIFSVGLAFIAFSLSWECFIVDYKVLGLLLSFFAGAVLLLARL